MTLEITPAVEEVVEKATKHLVWWLQRERGAPPNEIPPDELKRTTRQIVLELLENLTVEQQLTITHLRWAGWQNAETHELFEGETEDDWRPTDSIPVWVCGKVAVGLPMVELEEGDEASG